MTDYETELKKYPPSVDIGGVYYNTCMENNVDLLYKGKLEFTKTFKDLGDINEIIYLFRKYMNRVTPEIPPTPNIGEIDKLIDILKKHSANIRKNTSVKILKNNHVNYSVDGITKAIENLEKMKTVTGGTRKSIKVAKPISAKPIKAKAIKELDDATYVNMLELSWLLLNPDSVSKSKKSWKSLVKKTKKMTMYDVISMIKEDHTIIPSSKNHFEKNSNATDDISKQNVSDLIVKLMKIIEIKKHLTATNTIDTNYTNTFNTSIYKAFIPLCNYFNVLYDPLYSFLDKTITSYKNHNISNMLTLLHICNLIKNPGIYRVSNVTTLPLIKHILTRITKHLHTISDYNKKIASLPKMGSSHVQLCVLGNNLKSDDPFFNKDALYVVCKSSTDCYDIDLNMNIVKNESVVNVTYTKNKFNSAELALSIFITFKELLPK